MKEHIKLAVWPRGPSEGPEGKIYRYIVLGMIVTDEPLPNLEALLAAPSISETVLDYSPVVPMLGYLLDSAPQRPPRRTMGDASNVLLSLKEI